MVSIHIVPVIVCLIIKVISSTFRFKCGINRLSDDRLWRTREQINNTHTCRYILRMVYDETSDECSAVPVLL